MLSELNIKNFAIIDELKVIFGHGLNVISGETGAGKSILIGAVSLILGDKASVEQIRTSEDAATVEALFTTAGHQKLREKLVSFGFEPDEDLIIRRTISRSGKGRVYINGQLANLGILSSLGEMLINICGQHEHEVILDSANHIEILDEFGGLIPLRMEFTRMYNEYHRLKSRFAELNSLTEKKLQTQEFLKFQLKEIQDAAPSEGEDLALAEEKKIIQSARLLQDHAAACYETIYARDGSVLAELADSIHGIKEIKKIDPGLKVSIQDLDSIALNLEEIALILRDYMNMVSFDPVRLEAINDRLELLGRLKRKYGGTILEILKKGAEISRQLEGISSADEEMTRISGQMSSLEAALMEKAHLLSTKRHLAASELKSAIEKEIHTLRLENTRFEAVCRTNPANGDPASTLDERGMDVVEFYISPNVGEDMKPLQRIASGGELSRIVLSMKKVLAGAGSVATIVFDEVDSGIGGAVAEIIGEKLKDVAKTHQIICITHLPQIASFGDVHHFVSKHVEGGRTNTRIRRLTETERPEEIARMLAGSIVTEKTRKYAREMLAKGQRSNE